MPYLDRDWMVDSELLTAGTWVPETNWDRWQRRGVGLVLPWRLQSDPARTHPFASEQDEHLGVLARDMGSAQRDGLIYTNLVERLKNSPNDTMADDVVDQMRALGLASASWPSPVGGPPPHESPRPWKTVLDWLFRQLGKVSKFLLDCAEFAMVSLAPFGVSAVAIGISWPPSLSFEFPESLFKDPPKWSRARTFVDNMMEELSEKMFE